MRSTSLRNVISNGSVTMLILVYCILLYPILYLFTKSGSRGGQSILHAICSPEYEVVNMAEDATVSMLSTVLQSNSLERSTRTMSYRSYCTIIPREIF